MADDNDCYSFITHGPIAHNANPDYVVMVSQVDAADKPSGFMR